MRMQLGILLALGAAVASADQTASVVTPQQIARAEARALDHLATQARQLGLDPGDLTVSRADVDSSALIHVRVRQVFRGIPVFGGEAILHYRSSGELFGETNTLVPHVKVGTQPRITTDAAIARATADSGCTECLTAKPLVDLWVVRHEGMDHLTYRVRLGLLRGNTGPGSPVVFVDAHDGHIVQRYDNLQTGDR